jgi:sulfatase maturation enzyme AslB (radical SAM superfamily)
MNIWNGEVLAIHLTEYCNLKCKYCYLQSLTSRGNIADADIRNAIQKIGPDTLFMYGGEPLLQKDVILKIMEEFPDQNYIVETNGCLLTEELMEYFVDKQAAVVLSLDSFDYEKNNRGRNVTKQQFDNIIRIIHQYKQYQKLVLMCSIHEQTEDFNNYYEIVQKLGLPMEIYLIVSGQRCDIRSTPFYAQYKSYPSAVKAAMTQFWDHPNVIPKLRVHCNGMVSRSLNYDSRYDICHVSQWEEGMRTSGILPYPKSCELCRCFMNCFFMHTFPQWAYELEQEKMLHHTFACQASKLLAEEAI